MRFIPVLLFLSLLWFSGCKQEIVPEPYKPRNEHDAYRYALEQADLLKTALGNDWIESSKSALVSPVRIESPYKEAFYLDPTKADAAGYRFSVKRGQKIEMNVTFLNKDTMQVFIDLYRVENDSMNILRHVASADSLDHSLAFEPRRDADYIVRLQPELLRGGRFGITIKTVPSFTFPVTGKNSRAIGSYFGDPRDGGSRDHHGVDIFARRHTPIIAPVDAYVRRVGERGLGGNVIWLRDDKGRNLYFAHLQTQIAVQNTYVEAGDTIGTVGNTGNARTTPTHLHFGIYQRGPIDPIWFIKETNTRFPDVKADLSLLGNWIRTTDQSYLFPIDPSNRIDTLEQYQPMRIIGAVKATLRVALPDGSSGYVNVSDVESVSEALQIHEISEPFALLNNPVDGSDVMNNLEAGDNLSILGKQGEYFFVMTPLGNLGWIQSIN